MNVFLPSHPTPTPPFQTVTAEQTLFSALEGNVFPDGQDRKVSHPNERNTRLERLLVVKTQRV